MPANLVWSRTQRGIGDGAGFEPTFDVSIPQSITTSLMAGMLHVVAIGYFGNYTGSVLKQGGAWTSVLSNASRTIGTFPDISIFVFCGSISCVNIGANFTLTPPTSNIVSEAVVLEAIFEGANVPDLAANTTASDSSLPASTTLTSASFATTVNAIVVDVWMRVQDTGVIGTYSQGTQVCQETTEGLTPSSAADVIMAMSYFNAASTTDPARTAVIDVEATFDELVVSLRSSTAGEPTSERCFERGWVIGGIQTGVPSF